MLSTPSLTAGHLRLHTGYTDDEDEDEDTFFGETKKVLGIGGGGPAPQMQDKDDEDDRAFTELLIEGADCEEKSRQQRKQERTDEVLGLLADVQDEREDLSGKKNRKAFVARAYRFRARAEKLFHFELKRFQKSKLLSAEQKADLADVHFTFDRATQRLGLCKKRRNTRRIDISLSAPMVDGGLSSKQVRLTIIHELTHASLAPGTGHKDTWKWLNKRMGGDGQRCSSNPEVGVIIKPRVQVTCSKDKEHFDYGRMKHPGHRKCCPVCGADLRVVRIRYK